MDLNAILSQVGKPPMPPGGMAPGMQGGMPPGMPPVNQPGDQTPPPEVLLSLAKIATSLDPLALGSILFKALNSAHLPLNAQGISSLEGKPPMPPMNAPMGKPPTASPAPIKPPVKKPFGFPGKN